MIHQSLAWKRKCDKALGFDCHVFSDRNISNQDGTLSEMTWKNLYQSMDAFSCVIQDVLIGGRIDEKKLLKNSQSIKNLIQFLQKNKIQIPLHREIVSLMFHPLSVQSLAESNNLREDFLVRMERNQRIVQLLNKIKMVLDISLVVSNVLNSGVCLYNMIAENKILEKPMIGENWKLNQWWHRKFSSYYPVTRPFFLVMSVVNAVNYSRSAFHIYQVLKQNEHSYQEQLKASADEKNLARCLHEMIIPVLQEIVWIASEHPRAET